MPNESCVLVCRVADLMLRKKDVPVRGNRKDGVALHSATSSQGSAEPCVPTCACVHCTEVHSVYVLVSTAISWLSVAQQVEAVLSGLAFADPLGGFSESCGCRPSRRRLDCSRRCTFLTSPWRRSLKTMRCSRRWCSLLPQRSTWHGWSRSLLTRTTWLGWMDAFQSEYVGSPR